MKVLVTGGAGFIGSHIARYLNTRAVHQVAVVDDLSGGFRRNVGRAIFDQVDITNTREIDGVFDWFRPDVVVHCAAYAAEGLSHWMRRFNAVQNAVGWANIANNVIRHRVKRVVVCSTMAVYGNQTPPFDESMQPMPVDPYGAAKTAMEADVKALGDVFGTEWVIVRLHNVYGPRQNLADPYRNVVAIFTRQALEGRPITVFGDGTQTRAFSYIEDVAPVIAQLATRERLTHQIVNIGGEDPVSIFDLAHLVKEVSGTSSPIVHTPPRHEVQDAFCDHKALREMYGKWEPTPLRKGYGRMFRWASELESIQTPRQYDYEVDNDLFEPWRR